jgi:transcriptional regulator with XRE-family HTH domain
MSSETTGQRLRRFRKKVGLSQRELATRMGVTTGAISQWELDLVNVLGKHLVKASAILGVSPGDILSGEGNVPLHKLDLSRVEAALAALDSLPKSRAKNLSTASRAKVLAHLYLVGTTGLTSQELASLVDLVE